MPRMLHDFYATLGVPSTASAHEIKRAYRRLAREHHPDRNVSDVAGATERFKQLGAAYAVLGDVDKRAKYDLARIVGESPRVRRRGPRAKARTRERAKEQPRPSPPRPSPPPRSEKRRGHGKEERASTSHTRAHPFQFEEFFGRVIIGSNLDEAAPVDLGTDDWMAGGFDAEEDVRADGGEIDGDDYASDGDGAKRDCDGRGRRRRV